VHQEQEIKEGKENEASGQRPEGTPMTNRTIKLTLIVLLGFLVSTAAAQAETPAPGWQATVRTLPTYLRPGGKGVLQINVYNVGAAPSNGTATVTDVLPPGIEATGPAGAGGECSGTTIVTCELGSVEVGKYTPIGFGVVVKPEASGTALNRVTVAGGGALVTTPASDPIVVSSTPPPFGFADFQGWFSNADGTLDTQAGSHPYELTIAYDLNTFATLKEEAIGAFDLTDDEQEQKNVEVELPPGFIGNPTAVPECPRQQFETGNCSNSTQVGIDEFKKEGVGGRYDDYFVQPVYDLVPPPGVAAQFAFTIFGNQIFLDATVRSGGDYGITEHADNLPQTRQVAFNTITIWGVPAEASHTDQRGVGCLGGSKPCDSPSGAGAKPFLTLPTSCEGPQTFTGRVDSWEDPSEYSERSFLSENTTDEASGFTGCGDLQFGPSITTAPDTSEADTPAGLTADVKVTQEGLSSPEGLSTADLKNTTVTLPQGVVINPGQAAGLVACQESEARIHVEESAPECPSASKVGEDEIETPLLPHSLKGAVYVLQSNPPNLRLLVTASGEGVSLKLVGDVHLDESTGQLVTTFNETPELPFTNFRLSFSGGAQAALDTPAACGTYTTNADFTPWSTPLVQDLLDENSFAITTGSDGTPCPSSPLPFDPSLTAGATTDQAGGFTDFSLLLQRGDDQQRIAGLQFKAPAGLTGELSKVPLCTNAQAEANACPEASKIGHTVVAAGPGPYPLVVPEPGQEPAPIYLTESYEGAPFGLSIVVPLHVGPFTLPTQRVRAKIEVNPQTAALTITTGELPQIVAGVPTDLRQVDAVIERPEFMVNPTNCSPQEFSGTAYGTPPPGTDSAGVSAAISSHFQVGSCRSLQLTPKFVVSTAAKTSRARGASLTAKLTYPRVPQGTEANIGKFKVDLPKQLPSRLTTLQKACAAAQFESNPAGCPVASLIGHAVVHTPLLPVPVEGPVYFVSHGGEAFPSLEIVLQGDGVTVELIGSTFISKAGITSTTFNTTPDVPFSSFELTLPEGKYSALAANGNLCTSKLAMPTAIIGQNGAEIHQSTKIAVTGCPKALNTKTKAKKKHKAKKAKKAR
jgi:hypothetical protein